MTAMLGWKANESSHASDYLWDLFEHLLLLFAKLCFSRMTTMFGWKANESSHSSDYLWDLFEQLLTV
jgi:hypothetical protein